MTIKETCVSHRLGEATVHELHESLRAPLIQPHDEGYDDAPTASASMHQERLATATVGVPQTKEVRHEHHRQPQ
jgi:hypothetical protein